MKARHRPRSRLWSGVFERLYGPFAEVIVRETVKRGTESVDKVKGQVCHGGVTERRKHYRVAAHSRLETIVSLRMAASAKAPLSPMPLYWILQSMGEVGGVSG